MDPRERLRRLAFDQLPADAEGRASAGARSGRPLDAKTVSLARLAALVAIGGGAGPSYGQLADDALSAGASVEEIVDVLVELLPVVGRVRVVAAAPALALALGLDTDDLPQA
ncbi:hypothetical protein GHK92_19570 [Nocardioides sp. dk4132]|uniref:carboxymuconolactone decarboxylase family protein n=1 Tax=unclassified Nocardioides TaxID=2615069 RepID=UPI001295F980|nr:MULTISPECIES: carboxymuconolactone decarboxylase family protein [unclassified Nocardioides]MQW78071.1 hypothetical protein [Nocardioides sp. dk4132]QGA08173.1 hypothetical protein GFH29_12745 [Nocardioides sp. dk884]